MILNRQKRAKVDLAGARAFAMKLQKVLGLGDREFNVCFVDDQKIRQLNAAYRGKRTATDVLSFPWSAGETPDGRGPGKELEGFLGDVVISVETARRQAQTEGHSTSTEINSLLLHGLLHLLGMDHETDGGEMAALELDLRARLALEKENRRSDPSRAHPREGMGRTPSKRRLEAEAQGGSKPGRRRRSELKPAARDTAGRG